MLKNKITASVIIGLPLIARHEWIERGFDPSHHACPPIIFGDELKKRDILLSIENYATIIERGGQKELDEEQWRSLKEILLGHPKSSQTNPTDSKAIDQSLGHVAEAGDKGIKPGNKKEALLGLASWISDVDHQQARIGLQIPPGPQRIRGIAGSGKTVLLCQKAARMHLQHPDWKIALVFFTRTLYELIPAEVNRWLQFISGGEREFDLATGNLKVIHAWGTKDKPGFYSILRDRARRSPQVKGKPVGRPEELLAMACRRLLEEDAIDHAYDAVLIDEGQDLSFDEEHKYEDKQAVYWLAWQSLRPVCEQTPNVKRLIWAYDEAQSLHSLRIPEYKEVFGPDLGPILSGQLSGPSYPGPILKNEVMRKCYRTPAPIITAAHGIGMGLLRLQGMLSGYTSKAGWEGIGYKVINGDFRQPGKQVTLKRPEKNSPNPIPDLSTQQVIRFDSYATREEQLDALVEQVRTNTQVQGLTLSRDQLIVLVGPDSQSTIEPVVRSASVTAQQQRIAIHLQQAGISFYVPGCSEPNTLSKTDRANPDRFWCDDAITISTTYFAKGHQAPQVYVLGLEALAEDESNITLRNQLFVALTRSTAWASMSGLRHPETGGDFLFYQEIRQVLESGDTFKFIYRRLPTRKMDGLE